jgi:cobaltochelatase CobS
MSTFSTESLEESIKREMLAMLAAKKAELGGGTVKIEVAAEPEEAIVPVVHRHCSEGYKWASDVIGNKLPSEADFPVKVYTDEEWDEKIRCFIPEPKRGYVIQEEQALDILRGWQMNDRILISGPTGAGKSSLIEHLCALIRQPFVRFNATGDMDSSMIFGQLTAQDGSTVWRDGVVTEAVRYGAVCAWDEYDVTPPEISMGMQWLLEENGKLFLKEMPGTSKDKFIIPHPDFRLVCLGNTLGQGDETGHHAGTTPQNSATIDRFGTAIRIGYLGAVQEAKMICSVIDKMPKGAADKLVKFAALVRQGYEQNTLSYTMSPRALLAVGRKMVTWGLTPRQACEKVYFNKLSPSQRRAAEQLFDKVYGTGK